MSPITVIITDDFQGNYDSKVTNKTLKVLAGCTNLEAATYREGTRGVMLDFPSCTFVPLVVGYFFSNHEGHKGTRRNSLPRVLLAWNPTRLRCARLRCADSELPAWREKPGRG